MAQNGGLEAGLRYSGYGEMEPGFLVTNLNACCLNRQRRHAGTCRRSGYRRSPGVQASGADSRARRTKLPRALNVLIRFQAVTRIGWIFCSSDSIPGFRFRKSIFACRLIQNRSLVPKNLDNRNAMSVDRRRFPCTRSNTVLVETCSSFDKR